MCINTLLPYTPLKFQKDYNRLFSIKGFGHGGATDSIDAQVAAPTPVEKEPVVGM